MKRLHILVVFLLMMPLAYSEQLFSGSVDDKESFQAGEYDCYVKYSPGNSKLVFEVDDWTRILEAGECFQEENMKACFDSVSIDEDFGTATSITVSVYSLAPSITIERTFSDTSTITGEEIEVNTIIKNEGEKGALNVVFTDSFPAELKLISGEIEGNSVKWTGKLNVDSQKKLRYKLKAKGIVEYPSKARVSYQFSGETKTEVSDEETIKVDGPYSFSAELSSESPKKGEIITLDLLLENKGNNRLTVNNLVIETSKHVEIVDFSGSLREKDSKVTYSGIIDGEDTKNLFVRVYSPRVGEHSVKTTVDLTANNLKFHEEKIKKFGIGISKIFAIINVSPKIVKSSDDIKLRVYLKNTGDKEIRSINARVESDLFESIDELNKKVYQGRQEEIVYKTIVAPDVQEKTTYTINVVGSYTDIETKQTFTFKAQDEVTVKKKDKIMDTSHELNKEGFELGDEVTVDVFITNLKNIELTDVSLIEMLPNEVKSSLKGNITIDMSSLGPNQRKKAYSYTFTIPTNYNKNILTLKTITNAKLEGSLNKHEKIRELTIGGVEGNITEYQDTTEEPTLKEDEELETEKQISVFKKIISFFKSLFTRSQPEEQE